MIDTFYIESAKSIRAKFLSLNRELQNYESELRRISQLMLDTAKELEIYRDGDINKETNVVAIKDYIVSKLDHLDNESNKLAKKINPINENIEKLKQDELNLYRALKSKYSELSDQQIRDEIQKHLV